MSRKMKSLTGVALLALAVLGFLLPTLRSGELTVDPTAVTSVLVAALIAGTVLGITARKR